MRLNAATQPKIVLEVGIAEVATLPFIAWLVDRLPTRNHVLLLAAASMRMALLFSDWLVIALSSDSALHDSYFSVYWLGTAGAVFNVLGNAYNISVWKVIKRHVLHDVERDTMAINVTGSPAAASEFDCDAQSSRGAEVQTSYITRIGIYARLLAMVVRGVLFLALYLLIDVWHISADTHYVLIVGLMCGFGLIEITSAARICTIHKALRQRECMHQDSPADMPLIASDGHPPQPGRCTTLVQRTRISCAARNRDICGSAVLRWAVIHMICVYMLNDIIVTYAPLHLAGRHGELPYSERKYSNFCGSYLPNLYLQNVWSSLLWGGGAVVYIAVVIPFVSARLFFGLVYPVLAVVAGTAAFGIVQTDSNTYESASASLLAVLLTIFSYSVHYDSYFVLGRIPSSAIGYFQFLYYAANQSWQLLGLLLLYYDAKTVTVMVLNVGLILFSLPVSWHCARTLKVEA